MYVCAENDEGARNDEGVLELENVNYLLMMMEDSHRIL